MGSGLCHWQDVSSCQWQQHAKTGLLKSKNHMVLVMFRKPPPPTNFTSLKLSKAERMMSCPPLTRQTAASNSKTRALVLSRQIKTCQISMQTGQQGTFLLKHKETHLGFLLLRLSVISFTQRGWVITRLKPDWKQKKVLKQSLTLQNGNLSSLSEEA